MCSRGGERWHREVAGTWNLYLRVVEVGGNGSKALNPQPKLVDGSLILLGLTTTHELTSIAMRCE